MGTIRIELIFQDFVCKAELFDTNIANRFADNLPYNIPLTCWGNELYGPIHKNLGTENPVQYIPKGGIAYTNQGGYVCIFFGQTPAWPVEHVGQISDDGWHRLTKCSNGESLIIRAFED